jgi:hypothetical protein
VDEPAATGAPSNSSSTYPTSALTPLLVPGKRKRPCGDGDPLPTTPNRKRPRFNIEPQDNEREEEEEVAMFDEFPSDSALFENSIVEEGNGEGVRSGVDPSSATGKGKTLSGNNLLLFNRTRHKCKVKTFNVRNTIGMLYLALQYTHQKILLSDLNR